MSFDLSRAIPINATGERQPAFDVSRAVPVQQALEDNPQENSLQETKPKERVFTKNADSSLGKLFAEDIKQAPLTNPNEGQLKRMETSYNTAGNALQAIRWPFWRFAEHPVSTLVQGAQEGDVSSIPRALQTFIPFRQIPKEEYGSYAKVWDNYYQSTMKLDNPAFNEATPDWYVALASFGSAAVVEPLAIKGGLIASEKAMTRVATTQEAEFVRGHFDALKTQLQKRGLDSSTLHPEGNIIKIDQGNELFLNKYVSAVLRGDEVRVPRWAKIHPSQAPMLSQGSVGTGVMARPPDVFPVTGPSTVLPLQQTSAANELVDQYVLNRSMMRSKPSLEGKKILEEIFTPISSRLERIDPELKTAIRTFEFNLAQSKIKDTDAVVPFLQGMKTMSLEDRADLDLALKNGDQQKISQITLKYGLGDAHKAVTKTLAEARKREIAVGAEVGYIEGYWPRHVLDAKGFNQTVRGSDQWPTMQKAIAAKEAAVGRALNDDERAQVINSLLRGYSVGKIKLAKPSNLKYRNVDQLTAELNKYYDSASNSLLRYIENVNNNVEARRFFGNSIKTLTDDSGQVDIPQSVGAYTLELLAKNKITPTAELELRDILTARFNQQGTRGIVTTFKNLSYIDTMGSPISAITQIGDLAWSVYENGYLRTGGALLKAIAGKSEVSKKDIGVERIAEELTDGSKSSKAVSKIFKLIGLEKIDTLGKETFINSTLSKLRTEAKAGRLEKVLDPRVIADLKAGIISDEVKLVLFNELLDYQPVAMSEMPEKYLTGGNARIWYMLKSFTLKQVDAFRRESFDKIARGEVKEGLSNLVKLAVAFMLANASADVIKDIVLGRRIEIDDLVLDNILKVFGLSKYQVYKAKLEGIGTAVAGSIIFPAKAINATYKDLRKIKASIEDPEKPFNLKDAEIAQSVPLVGKLYYWWFGGGREKENARGDSDYIRP